MYSIFISTICPVESIIAKDVTFIISAVMRRVDSSCYAGKRKDWYTFLRCGLLISKTQFGKELDEEVESLIKKDRRRDSLPMFQSTFPTTVSERRRMKPLDKREKVASMLWVEANKTLVDALGMEERSDSVATFTLITSEGSKADTPQVSMLRAHVFTPTLIHTL